MAVVINKNPFDWYSRLKNREKQPVLDPAIQDYTQSTERLEEFGRRSMQKFDQRSILALAKEDYGEHLMRYTNRGIHFNKGLIQSIRNAGALNHNGADITAMDVEEGVPATPSRPPAAPPAPPPPAPRMDEDEGGSEGEDENMTEHERIQKEVERNRHMAGKTVKKTGRGRSQSTKPKARGRGAGQQGVRNAVAAALPVAESAPAAAAAPAAVPTAAPIPPAESAKQPKRPREDDELGNAGKRFKKDISVAFKPKKEEKKRRKKKNSNIKEVKQDPHAAVLPDVVKIEALPAAPPAPPQPPPPSRKRGREGINKENATKRQRTDRTPSPPPQPSRKRKREGMSREIAPKRQRIDRTPSPPPSRKRYRGVEIRKVGANAKRGKMEMAAAAPAAAPAHEKVHVSRGAKNSYIFKVNGHEAKTSAQLKEAHDYIKEFHAPSSAKKNMLASIRARLRREVQPSDRVLRSR